MATILSTILSSSLLLLMSFQKRACYSLGMENTYSRSLNNTNLGKSEHFLLPDIYYRNWTWKGRLRQILSQMKSSSCGPYFCQRHQHSFSCLGIKHPRLIPLHQPLYLVTYSYITSMLGYRHWLSYLFVCLPNSYNHLARCSLLLNSLLLSVPIFSVSSPTNHTTPRLIFFKENWSYHFFAQKCQMTLFCLPNLTVPPLRAGQNTILNIFFYINSSSGQNGSHSILPTTLPFFMPIPICVLSLWKYCYIYFFLVKKNFGFFLD